MRYHPVYRDKNHIPIVTDLRKHGYQVIDLAAVGNSVPDIMVADSEVTALIELKVSDGRFYLSQLEFLAKWPGIAGFAECLADCIALMRRPDLHRLTDIQKQTILQIVADLRADPKRDERQPRIQVAKFEKLYRQALEAKL